MKSQRPIDVLRNSAKSGRIGGDGDDSAITEMIPIGDKLYIVKERGIYAMQLADQIDPQRTNAGIPDTQQKILPIGSDDPLVARTLMKAHTLFNPTLMDLHEYDAHAWAVGQQRIKVIAALAAAEKTDKASVEAAASELGICRAYCYRLLRRYREDAGVTLHSVAKRTRLSAVDPYNAGRRGAGRP
jgi:hypothetical protein